MNERPDQNRGVPGESRTTGNFKLNIDERDLATGNVDLPEYRRNAPPAYPEAPTARKAYYTEEERRAEKKAHKKRDKLKARKNRRVFSIVWLCMVLLVSFTLASYLIGGSNDFFAVGRQEGTVQIEIPANATTEELAKLLHEKGVINKPDFFSIYCKVRGGVEQFEPNVPYHVETNLDYEDLINTLRGGNEVKEEVTVTFPEGMTALQIGQLLEENEVCTKDDFLAALNSDDFDSYDMIGEITNASERYYKLEGYLFPDTYDFYKESEANDVVAKMLENFQSKVTDDIRSQAQRMGMTLDDAIVYASIIQGEAANANDMYNVSAVLHNRIAFGADYAIYRLECDSTQYYPYKNGQEVPETDALPFGNYDTYKIDGLPAGAICNPGMDAIMAAVKPASDGDAPYYLYFCHGDDGTAYYATNEGDHLYNLELAGIS